MGKERKSLTQAIEKVAEKIVNEQEEAGNDKSLKNSEASEKKNVDKK